MTLNDNLYESASPHILDDRADIIANECERVCEDFALRFAEWLSEFYSITHERGRYTLFSHDPLDPSPTIYTTSELIQKFKTEVYEKEMS